MAASIPSRVPFRAASILAAMSNTSFLSRLLALDISPAAPVVCVRGPIGPPLETHRQPCMWNQSGTLRFPQTAYCLSCTERGPNEA
ncbi:hypothetical protein EDD85DRAFT_869821 [Armillaria nabsnona]|nr:hypothetical protein EDD85DRAFT_869821 [Armillaria nabsnona]